MIKRSIFTIIVDIIEVVCTAPTKSRVVVTVIVIS